MEIKTYVRKHPSGVYRVGDTKVSLDSIVYAHLDGGTPEEIVGSFPALTLDDVQGAVAFYLANREHVHEYLKHQEAVWKAARQEAEARPNPAWDRLVKTKQARQTP
jgi:uncharacterized protein (DUF433 family)